MKREVMKRIMEDVVRNGVVVKRRCIREELSCGHVLTNVHSIRLQAEERECKECPAEKKGSQTGTLKRTVQKLQAAHLQGAHT